MEKKRMPKRHDIHRIVEHWEGPSLKDSGIITRAAAFLNFAAQEAPGTPIAWSIVTKCVMGGKRMPTPDSKLVIDMMRRASSIRLVLERDFKRTLENVSGMGVRASVDDDDMANTQLRRDAKRHERTGQRMAKTRAMINTKNMKNKALKAWVENDISQVLTLHTSRLSRLLLPPGEEAPEAPKSGRPPANEPNGKNTPK
jgi:hypothetical protein